MDQPYRAGKLGSHDWRNNLLRSRLRACVDVKILMSHLAVLRPPSGCGAAPRPGIRSRDETIGMVDYGPSAFGRGSRFPDDRSPQPWQSLTGLSY